MIPEVPDTLRSKRVDEVEFMKQQIIEDEISKEKKKFSLINWFKNIFKK